MSPELTRRKSDSSLLGFRLSREVSFGHILLVGSWVVLAILGYAKFEQRIAFLETNQSNLVNAISSLKDIAAENKYFRQEYMPRIQRLEQGELFRRQLEQH